MKNFFNVNVKQFIKFSFVGMLNTLIDFGIYYLLTRYAGLYYIYANIISVFIAITNSYLLNRSWTFQSKSKIVGIEAVKFWIVSIVGLILNTLISKLLIYLGLGDLFSKAFASVLVLIWNFTANKYWTFSSKYAKH